MRLCCCSTADRGRPSISRAVPYFADGFQVIVVEVMGHGRTADDVDRSFHYHDMAEDLVELMRVLGIESASILGYSDGGVVGLDMAIHHPDLVRKLAVTGANSRVDGYTAEVQESTRTFVADEAPVSEAYARLSPDGADHWPVFLGRLQRMWVVEPSRTAEQLQSIGIPTLLIVGDADILTRWLVPRGQIAAVRARIRWRMPRRARQRTRGPAGGARIAKPMPLVQRKKAHSRVDQQLDQLEAALLDAVLPPNGPKGAFGLSRHVRTSSAASRPRRCQRSQANAAAITTSAPIPMANTLEPPSSGLGPGSGVVCVDAAVSATSVATAVVDVTMVDEAVDEAVVDVGGGVAYQRCTPALPSLRFGTFSTGVPNRSVVPTASVKRDGPKPVTVRRYSPACADSPSSR